MKNVEFIKSFGPYNPGDEATFPDDRAKALVDSEVAKEKPLPKEAAKKADL